MSNQIKGRIKTIFPTIQVSEKFSKRDVVITTTTDMYPQDILVQFTQDRCAVLDTYKVGQEVDVDYNLRGRGWINPQGEAKYFNTIEGWRISLASGASPIPQDVQKTVPVQQLAPIQEQGDDDLPF